MVQCYRSIEFPRHHEVRWAQHKLQLLEAVLHNYDIIVQLANMTDKEIQHLLQKPEVSLQDVGIQEPIDSQQTRRPKRTVRPPQQFQDFIMEIDEMQQDFDILNEDMDICQDHCYNELKMLLNAQPLSHVKEVANSLKIFRALQKSLQSTNLEFKQVSELTQNAINSIKVRKEYVLDQPELASMYKAIEELLVERALKGDHVPLLLEASHHLQESRFVEAEIIFRKLLPINSDRLVLGDPTEIARIKAMLKSISPHSATVESDISVYNKILQFDRSSLNEASLRQQLFIARNAVPLDSIDKYAILTHFLTEKMRHVPHKLNMATFSQNKLFSHVNI
jgi:hypothetical protein